MKYNQKLIMSNIYSEIADYISSELYYNDKWTKEKDYFDIESIISKDKIIKIYKSGPYSDKDIEYCYNVIKNHYIECKELNNKVNNGNEKEK